MHTVPDCLLRRWGSGLDFLYLTPPPRPRKSAIFHGRARVSAAAKELLVTVSRRQFVATSSLSVAALGIARLPVFAQTAGQAAAAQAPPTQVGRDPPRRGLLHRERRHDRLPDHERRRDRGGQPVHAQRRAVRRRPEVEGAQGDRAAHQHASSWRSRQRQPGVPPRGEEDCRPRELRGVAPEDDRAGSRPAPQPDTTLQGQLEGGFRGRDCACTVSRPRPHQRRCRDLLREGQRRSRRRPALPPHTSRVDGPAGASIVNWVAILEKVAKAHDNDTMFVFGHGGGGVVLGKKADVTYFRDYLSAALDHTRAESRRVSRKRRSRRRPHSRASMTSPDQPAPHAGRCARRGVRRADQEVAAPRRRLGPISLKACLHRSA